MSRMGWWYGRRRAEAASGEASKYTPSVATTAVALPGSSDAQKDSSAGLPSGSSVSVTSTGSDATAAAALGLSTAAGPTGAGVKVGIISDSFDALGTAAADEADGALPTSVAVLSDNTGGRDEGRAMAEVAHGVAPGAGILFSAADGTVAGLAASIAGLQAAGCTVICDDVTFPLEPFFQMGDAAETAISTFTAAGGVYLTAASNAGPDSDDETAFSGIAATLPGIGAVTAMNFGTAAAPRTAETLTLTAGRLTSIDLQWAQPWASIDGTGATYSLAVAVYDPSGQLVKSFADDAVGRDPVQAGSFTPSVSGAYTVSIYVDGGTDPGGTFKIVANNNAASAAAFAGATGSGSVFGHNMDPRAITVGAVDAADTPAYGGTPKSEPFGAEGPGEELFGDTGTPLASAKVLAAVDVSGPDGIRTSLPGSDLNPFYGTSCATPAVAGVVALMKQANPSLDAGEIKTFLTASALPFGTAAQSGAGLVQAPGALALARGSNAGLTGDLFGDGRSAVLWQAGAGGSLAASELTAGGTTRLQTVSGPAGKGWTAVATGDFSGVPGQSGILWRNADGRLATQDTAGDTAGVSVTAQTALGNPGTAWSVAGVGDFAGDGTSDIVIDDAKTGQAAIVSPGANGADTRTALAGPGAGWTVAGVGDIGGDGRSDILWTDPSGDLAAWIMDGTSVASELQLSGTPGAGWSVVGVGDLTGDAKADVLLQNVATGALDLLAMTGAGVTSQTNLTGGPGAGWTAVGVGEFDGSGRDGILFADAATGGATVAAVSHGGIVHQHAITSPGAGYTPSVA